MIVVCDWLEVAICAFRRVLFSLFPFFSLSSFPPLLFLVLCVPQFLSPCFSLRPSGNFEYRPIGQRSIIGAFLGGPCDRPTLEDSCSCLVGFRTFLLGSAENEEGTTMDGVCFVLF